jgi:hypothetical protein
VRKIMKKKMTKVKRTEQELLMFARIVTNTYTANDTFNITDFTTKINLVALGYALGRGELDPKMP